jgi:hypothetical protein
VDTILFGSTGADDDDRRADSLRPGGADQLPAVEAGEHQVEHADLRTLEAQPRERHVALANAERIEARLRQVAGDRVCNHVVVFDDEHAAHDSFRSSPQRPGMWVHAG